MVLFQPHPNLEKLKIRNYPAKKFPDWVGDPSFFNLVSLELWNCKNCSSLPPLGQLPSLKHLCIFAVIGVKRLGSEFYRNASSSITVKPSFPSLQTLRFFHLPSWEKWLCCGCRHGEFPRLQELYIIQCPKLTGKLPKQLRSLKKLKIISCPQLHMASLRVQSVNWWWLTMANCSWKCQLVALLLFKLQKFKVQTSLSGSNYQRDCGTSKL